MSTHNTNKELLERTIELRRDEWNGSDLRHKTRNYKTVLLGACGVGKTSLVNRHLRGTFDFGSESTIGASFCTNNVKTSVGIVKLSIWDTAGQERYASLIPMYYRDANIALVVFDLTDIDSFERAKYWIDTVNASRTNPQAVSSNIDIILIGNKKDKDENLIQRLDREANEYAKEQGITFIKASARTGDGVVEIFSTAVVSKLKKEDEYGANANDGDGGLIIDINDQPKANLFSSCFGMPTFLTMDYWKSSEPLAVTDTDTDAQLEEDTPDTTGGKGGKDDNNDKALVVQ